MKQNIATLIALECERIHNARAANNANTSFNLDDARKRIAYFCGHLRTGSGIDSAVWVKEEDCSIKQVVFHVPFHAMEEGVYVGWEKYQVVATMDFLGMDLQIIGPQENADIVEQLIRSALEYVPTSEEIEAAQKEVYRVA